LIELLVDLGTNPEADNVDIEECLAHQISEQFGMDLLDSSAAYMGFTVMQIRR
jgi:hypothetical protein